MFHGKKVIPAAAHWWRKLLGVKLHHRNKTLTHAHGHQTGSTIFSKIPSSNGKLVLVDVIDISGLFRLSNRIFYPYESELPIRCPTSKSLSLITPFNGVFTWESEKKIAFVNFLRFYEHDERFMTIFANTYII